MATAGSDTTRLPRTVGAPSRFHETLRIGLAVISKTAPPHIALGRLFGRLLPEFQHRSVPRPLAANHVDRNALVRACGRYSDAATHIVVEQRESPELHMAFEGSSHVLRPCGDSLYIAAPAFPGRFTYIEFLRDTGGRYQHLWDGRQIYTRSDRASI